ncbi:NAD(P)-dependent oxidoreductase [Celerinatantimonas sp. YJH-8]|uniref:NAD(P)-dependent oxidoreductase n=1 Tax=Celerinatantimonas sp. YJH-8 TaxID=3228714 RepID=UPI0038C1AE63
MYKIAFLGLGAMGERMASHLLAAGYPLTVYNRTASRTDALVAQGAIAAATPKAAVSDADVVISIVRDDEASRDIWLDPQTGALAGMKDGALAIESSTLSVDGIKFLAKQAQLQHIDFLEAPVSGSRPQAENGSLIFLVGGHPDLLERCRPVLQCMGATIQHTGTIGCGALAKLCTNTLMGIQVAAIAELIGMLRQQHVDPDKIMQAVANTAVWSPIADRNLSLMLQHQTAPLFPIELIEKDLRYTLSAMAQPSPVIQASQQLFYKGIKMNMGLQNMTAIAELF